MTATADTKQPQSAAAPSPFPPIADYAFLSNCHTAALIAPDGAVDWLCIPGFESPSAFGSLLDREAGFFRFGPFGITHPTAQHYEPGTNVLVTTWKTPSGWLVVRDALTMGPTTHEDAITPHTRPPADDDADHMLVRTVECLGGRVEVELICEPAFDYGRTPAEWSLVDGDRHAADASGAGQAMRLVSDLPLGIEGNRVRGRHVLETGDKAFCALSWAEEFAAPPDYDDAVAEDRLDGAFLAELAERGAHSRPSLARPDPALGACDQGPDLHADGRDGRRRDHVAAGDARRRAQLGLPLHVDARHHVHAAGAPLAQPRLGGGRVHAVHRGPRAEQRRLAADHVRHRRSQGSDRVDARRPLGLRRRSSRPARQRRIRPAPERRLRRGARLDPAAHEEERAAAPPPLADRAVAGRVRDARSGRSRIRASGRRAASRSTTSRRS